VLFFPTYLCHSLSCRCLLCLSNTYSFPIHHFLRQPPFLFLYVLQFWCSPLSLCLSFFVFPWVCNERLSSFLRLVTRSFFLIIVFRLFCYLTFKWLFVLHTLFTVLYGIHAVVLNSSVCAYLLAWCSFPSNLFLVLYVYSSVPARLFLVSLSTLQFLVPTHLFLFLCSYLSVPGHLFLFICSYVLIQLFLVLYSYFYVFLSVLWQKIWKTRLTACFCVKPFKLGTFNFSLDDKDGWCHTYICSSQTDQYQLGRIWIKTIYRSCM